MDRFSQLQLCGLLFAILFISQGTLFGTTRIYQADIERAIFNILNIELPKVNHMGGKQLLVLRNILTLLNYLNPLNKDKRLGLNKLYKSMLISRKRDRAVFETELQSSFNSSIKDKIEGSHFSGCIAFKPNSRDFNCSLWTLFHYMTIKAARKPHIFKPGDILWAIHGYANYFLGCQQCYVNFWEFSMYRSIDAVKTQDDEILWLWEAHNDINLRLAKVQFPQEQDCPLCQKENREWRKDEVWKYLRRIFSYENLI